MSNNKLCIGDKVIIDIVGITGTLRFLGETEFKEGIWAGIELSLIGSGKNDGSVDGIKYFDCPDQTGIFVLESKISKFQTPLVQPPTIFSTPLPKPTEDPIETIQRLEKIIQDLKSVGLESIDLYQQAIDIHRIDRDALLASLTIEKERVRSLEVECQELRQAGLETIEVYEIALGKIRQEESPTVLDQKYQQLDLKYDKLDQKYQQLQLKYDKLDSNHQKTEIECLKLMEEVEFLHSEIEKEEIKVENERLKEEIKKVKLEKEGLKEEIKKVKLENEKKEIECQKLNEKLSELEGLMESKIFKETDLEELVAQEKKRVRKLELDILDLRQEQRDLISPIHSGISSPVHSVYKENRIFCELCELYGHDLFSCKSVVSK